MVAGVAQSRSFTTFGGVALPPCATQQVFAGVAQSVVQLIRNQQVASSSLVTSSIKAESLDLAFFD